MKFNLNDFVIALSHALDFMEIDFLGGVTYHSKRVAYITFKLAQYCKLPQEAIFDAVTLAILHDNGLGKAFQGDGESSNFSKVDTGLTHCLTGEENLKDYPFLLKTDGYLKYHHENWNGSGFFHLQADQIPLVSQIIRLADVTELHAKLNDIDYTGKKDLEVWMNHQKGLLLSPELVEVFKEVSALPAFWLDLKNEFVGDSLMNQVPRFDRDMDFFQIRKVSIIFSRIIDSKSQFTRLHSQELSEKAEIMANFYGYDPETTAKLCIAADLHDVGKLAVNNAILNKPGKLEPDEIDVIQRHTYYTRISLQNITGFEEITQWAANHHEKLDGLGYPYRKMRQELDFNSRLLACLDIYQALTEIRPYRKALSHENTMNIMNEMAQAQKIDLGIVKDINEVFQKPLNE